MNIYLDTWTLEMWHLGTLSDTEIKFLDKLAKNANYKIVLSVTHFCEISVREDREGVLAFGVFLDRLPNKIFINNMLALEIRELMYAYLYFIKQPLRQVTAFVDNISETLLSPIGPYYNSIAEYVGDLNVGPNYLQDYDRGLKQIIPTWAENNSKKAGSICEKQKWKKIIKNELALNLYNRSLRLLPFGLENWRFVAFLMRRPQLTQSILLTFYLTHVLFRDNTRGWKTSDFGDIEACSVIPYVDQIVHDSEMCKYYRDAILASPLKDESPSLLSRLNKNVTALSEKLR